ncbi:MAG TPA: carboxypeptidase regulatory-like domain-containing protein [Gemmatimonadaceae bacterium]|nr:carboxypeptidase regulatory-like domain-containing protein [Gemmatimonadaceae bacterium]
MRARTAVLTAILFPFLTTGCSDDAVGPSSELRLLLFDEAPLAVLMSDTIIVTARVVNARQVPIESATVIWSVRDKAIAPIVFRQTANGVSTATLVGKLPGETMITARSGSLEESRPLTVGRGIVTGTVVDAATGAPIKGATLDFISPGAYWDYGNPTAMTNDRGTYASPPISLTKTEVLVQSPGYEPASRLVELMVGQPSVANISLIRQK